MKTYVALLRGINVGGHKKIKMAALKSMFENMDCQDVTAYIQSGNIVFRSSETSKKKLESVIEKGIELKFGFEVPVLVKSVAEIKEILDDSPYTNSEDLEANHIYYTLLKTKPEKESVVILDQKKYPNELFLISDNCIYLNCLNGAGKAKLTNTIIEKKLGVVATTRNHKTMVKLIDLAT